MKFQGRSPRRSQQSGKRSPKFLTGAEDGLDISRTDIPVQHPAVTGNANAGFGEMGLQRRHVHGRIQHHHVGLGLLSQPEAVDSLQPGGEASGVVVILRPGVDVVMQCMQTRGGDNASMAQPAAEHLAPAASTGDGGLVADEQ